MKVVLYETSLQGVLEAFQNALHHAELSYRLSGLKRYGFEDDFEIHLAIKRALEICRALGIDPKHHFSHFYRVDLQTKEAQKDWKVSKFGFYLVLCSGRTNNPFTAALQVEMLKTFMSKLE